MKYKYTIDDLRNIIPTCLSIAQVCNKLGIRPCGGNYKTLKNKIDKYQINISHFTGKGWNVGERFKIVKKPKDLSEILIENSPAVSTYHLKIRLLNENILQYFCSECGLYEWNGKKLILELDHINGNNIDNRLENLRLLCPNCHSQTETFRGKSKLSASSERKKGTNNHK